MTEPTPPTIVAPALVVAPPQPEPPHPPPPPGSTGLGSTFVIGKRDLWRNAITFGVPAVLLLAVIAYAALYASDKAPLRLGPAPFPLAETVQAGDFATPAVFRCNDAGHLLFRVSAQQLVNVDNGSVIALAAGVFVQPPGCVEQHDFILIPTRTPPGVYRIETFTEVDGAWHSYIVYGQSQPFTVTEASPLPTGSTGPAGPQGETGATGAAGPQGEPGDSP